MITCSGQYYKLFTAVITPLAAYFSMILAELRQKRRNYGCKKFYNIRHRWGHRKVFNSGRLQPHSQISNLEGKLTLTYFCLADSTKQKKFFLTFSRFYQFLIIKINLVLPVLENKV
jgi:hypothetical protein